MTLQRTYSAAVMLGLFFASLLFQQLHWLFVVLLSAFGILCLIEVGQLISLKSLRFPYFLCAAFALWLLADGYLASLRHGLYILVGALLILLIYRVLVSDYQNLAAEVGAALLATAYVGLPMAMAAALWQMTDLTGKCLGPGLMLFQVCVIFSGDTAAYFVGRRWGKHPFFPRLSPKKTIEGAVASVAGSIVLALIVTLVFPSLRHFLGVGHGLILGAVMGLMGPLGDLAESALKRDVGRKDSGHDFTGHGGFLDIFDAVLFGLPIQFCYVQLFLSAWLGPPP
jgi:phosphatidate cytidylyltransferase